MSPEKQLRMEKLYLGTFFVCFFLVVILHSIGADLWGLALAIMGAISLLAFFFVGLEDEI